MRAARRTAIWMLVSLLPVWAAAAPPRIPKENVVGVYRNLPRDPLLVLGIHATDAPGKFRDLLGLYDRFAAEPGPGPMNGPLVSIFESQVLPWIGPEVVLTLDLPPLDQAVQALLYSKGEALGAFLSRAGVVARVRDGEKLDRALHALVDEWGGKIHEEHGLTEVVLPLSAAPGADGSEPETSDLRAYYGLRGDLWALGFSPGWTRAALGPRPEGQRLADGEDFQKVFAHLDPQPLDLTYVNLPKLRAYIADSHVLRMVLQTTPEVREFVERYVTPETMSVGLGATSFVVEGGVRTTHFGPSWMSGTAMSTGLVAAMALPSLLVTGEEEGTRQTMLDIEAIAEACEGFSTDASSYPGPTEGWVPVSKIATYLEPIYIASLPRTDAWQNPILYWSDGSSYRILSRGRDGLMDRDWTGKLHAYSVMGLDGDIVIGDGRLLSRPAGAVAD